MPNYIARDNVFPDGMRYESLPLPPEDGWGPDTVITEEPDPGALYHDPATGRVIMSLPDLSNPDTASTRWKVVRSTRTRPVTAPQQWEGYPPGPPPPPYVPYNEPTAPPPPQEAVLEMLIQCLDQERFRLVNELRRARQVDVPGPVL